MNRVRKKKAKNPNAVALAIRRALSLTPERRREIALKANRARRKARRAQGSGTQPEEKRRDN